MTTVIQSLSSYSSYRDSRSALPQAVQHANLALSSTVYVGNLSFFTTEEQIYELFSKVGEVKRIIMGLDRNTKTPCGFCFVEYFSHLSALHSLRYLSGTKLDERFIRADLDPGYADNRQYGRGKSGGQVRDEYRDDFDAGRGGWGHLKTLQELEQSRQQEQNDLYANNADRGDVPMGEGRREEDDDGGERWRAFPSLLLPSSPLTVFTFFPLQFSRFPFLRHYPAMSHHSALYQSIEADSSDSESDAAPKPAKPTSREGSRPKQLYSANLDEDAAMKIVTELHATIVAIIEKSTATCRKMAKDQERMIYHLGNTLRRSTQDYNAVSFMRQLYHVTSELAKHISKGSALAEERKEVEESREDIVKVIDGMPGLERHKTWIMSPYVEEDAELGRMARRIGRQYYGMRWASGSRLV